ncbi:hypothetical protein DERP_006993 [Dermatophagoides pteronyssinus]|uniref:Uncharacterized protein n=1 Tax=Dermatophagoides pteronyssinus TaxID=6956 RepID=A0ABQ8JTV0_DERPT|nr:hypothetical protein DERP_006993 [Dermatophagoides pteronyssinus]
MFQTSIQVDCIYFSDEFSYNNIMLSIKSILSVTFSSQKNAYWCVLMNNDDLVVVVDRTIHMNLLMLPLKMN